VFTHRPVLHSINLHQTKFALLISAGLAIVANVAIATGLALLCVKFVFCYMQG